MPNECPYFFSAADIQASKAHKKQYMTQLLRPPARPYSPYGRTGMTWSAPLHLRMNNQ